MQKLPRILVLGSEGMLGRPVYAYLRKRNTMTWGTTRKTKNSNMNVFFFEADTYESNFLSIVKKLKKIDFIINCIGILKNYDVMEDLIYINALFPHKLLSLSKKYSFKIIHVSTDAVFSDIAGIVDEASIPSPQDKYGSSKYLGELSDKNALTVRTSIVGFDPINHKGILEWVRSQKNKKITGFENQVWSGCTTIQFAKFCEEIIIDDQFARLQKLSPVYHFVPIGPITKRQLIQAFINQEQQKKLVIKSSGTKITRVFKSSFFDFDNQTSYTTDINIALKELGKFEKTLL